MDDDIPPEVTARPAFRQLSPEEERAFLREQAQFEAAYRRTGEPLPLWEALCHIHRTAQVPPNWLKWALYDLVTKATTDAQAKRFRERALHVERYRRVRDLRATVNKRTGKKYTKDEALDEAVLKLQGVERDTIETSYWNVRRGLEREGSASEFFWLVDDDDPAKGG